jgi:SHS2 domain-containing protein
MKRSAAGYEEIEHTADVGYRLYAPTLEELFIIAGRALFATITELESIHRKKSVEIYAAGNDTEELLVAWLAELNYRCITAHELFKDFSISTLTSMEVSGVAHGEIIDPSRHVIHTEIKAVTYHGLYIRKSAAGWEAQVIFDV